MRVLGIDTAAYTVSAALLCDGQLYGEWTVRAPRRASRLLPASIDDWMKSLELGPQDLDGVAVTIGPGSYTGLRIGTALAVGLTLGRGLAAAGVSTTAALAAGVPVAPGGHIVSVVSAGRGAGFSALYRRPDISPVDEVHWVPEEVVSPARRTRVETESIVRERVPTGAFVVCAVDDAETAGEAAPYGLVRHLSPIRGAHVARLGWEQMRRGCSLSPEQLYPRYHRRTAAERGTGL